MSPRYQYLVRAADCRCHEPRTQPVAGGLVISASVGMLAPGSHGNVAADVRSIQSALNQVPATQGGARPELRVDGIAGPKTQAAIRHFQARHFAPALVDGRIDPDRYSIARLRDLLNAAPKAGGGSTPPAAPSGLPVTRDDEIAAHMFLYLAQARIRLAMVALDYAIADLTGHVPSGPNDKKPTVHWGKHLKMVDRCFHVIAAHHDINSMCATIRRIRAVYGHMYEVIANTLITTAGDEKTGRRRYIRVEPAKSINARWPQYPKGVLADASKGGWAARDAAQGRISLNRDTLYRPDAVITVIHEMAHFVSGPDTWYIEDHAYAQASLKLSHYFAVRTAACYEYLVFFATFPYYVDFDDKILQEPW